MGRWVIGLRFHLQTTSENVAAMIDHGREELREADLSLTLMATLADLRAAPKSEARRPSGR
jgi:hypothetical protein